MTLLLKTEAESSGDRSQLCKYPYCTNLRAQDKGWKLCASCMAATVRHMLHAQNIWSVFRKDIPKDKAVLKKAEDILKYVVANTDRIVAVEARAMTQQKRPNRQEMN